MGYVKAACLFIIVTCAGCGTYTYWYNEQSSFQRAKSDCMDCLFQAKQQVFEEVAQEKKDFDSSQIDSEAYEKMLFEKCMKDKGYKKVPDYSLDYDIRKSFFEQDDKQYFIAGK